VFTAREYVENSQLRKGYIHVSTIYVYFIIIVNYFFWEKTGFIIFVTSLVHRKKPSVLVYSKDAGRTDNVQIINVTSWHKRWSQWPRGVRRRSSAARMQRLCVRIPLGAWLFVVSVVCCQIEVSAADWSLVQRSPTDCGASLCVIKKPRTRGG
jgi:hypothetical protein